VLSFKEVWVITVPRWLMLAAVLMINGRLAWLAKLAVIVATDRRISDTGAADAFYLLGWALLALEATGFG
jgi:hypothetical protein